MEREASEVEREASEVQAAMEAGPVGLEGSVALHRRRGIHGRGFPSGGAAQPVVYHGSRPGPLTHAWQRA